jgi:hypothetical protein
MISTTLSDELIVLFWSFFTNISDYLIILIPLYLIYKLYSIYSDRLLKSEITNTLLIKILNLFTFGSKNTQLDNNNNENDSNLITTKIEQNDQASSAITLNKAFTFFICFTGLQVSFVVWGIMQERIIKYNYASKTDSKQLSHFKNSQFLVLANRLVGLCLSSLILITFSYNNKLLKVNSPLRKIVSAKNWPPLFICSYSSLSNVLSSWFQYEALKY